MNFIYRIKIKIKKLFFLKNYSTVHLDQFYPRLTLDQST